MIYVLICLLSATLAGFVQAVTGFGAGIVMMIFFPMFLPLMQGAGVSSMISIACQVSMLIRYRKFIRGKEVVFPVIFYMIFCALAIRLAPLIDVTKLKAFFGLFLVALAGYFIFLSKRLKLRATKPTAIACSSLSGAVSGLFGIGGPPMAMYFLALLGDDRFAYLATLQMFFFVTAIYSAVVRVCSGILTVEHVPYITAGMVGILTGTFIGGKFIARINAEMMKKIIYAFLAIVGVYTFVVNIHG